MTVTTGVTAPEHPGDEPPRATELRIGDALAYGWKAYWNNIGPLFLITIMMLAIELALGAVAALLADAYDSPFLGAVLGVGAYAAGLLLAFNWLRIALGVVHHRRPAVADLF